MEQNEVAKSQKTKLLLTGILPIVAILLLLGAVAAWRFTSSPDVEEPVNLASQPVNEITLDELVSLPDPQLQITKDNKLVVNGGLTVNQAFVLNPGEAPDNPLAGQLYYDSELNTFNYYDGDTFVTVVSEDNSREICYLGDDCGFLSVDDDPTAGEFLLANSSGVPNFVSAIGDVTISAAGAFSLSANSVGNNELVATGVIAGTYGDANNFAVISVDEDGRITSVSTQGWTAGDILNGGNSFGALMSIGTNDAFGLAFETSGTTRLSISDTGTINLDGLDCSGLSAGGALTTNASGDIICSPDDGGASGAPTSAQYLTLALDGSLSDERVFTAGTNLSLVDGGANGNLTLNVVDDPSFAGNVTIGDGPTDTVIVNAVFQNGSPLVFEGASADAFETTFLITDPDQDRTISFPNLDGEVSLLGQIIDDGEVSDVITVGATGSVNDGALSVNVTLLGATIQDGEVDDDLTISAAGSVDDGALSANVSLLGGSIQDAEVDDTITISAGGSVADGALSANVSLLGALIDSAEFTDGSLLEVDINSTNAPTDDFILSYDLGSGGFTWVADDTGTDSQLLFQTIDAPGGTDPVADSSTDTLQFINGNGITVTGNAGTDSITIAATLGTSIEDAEVDDNLTISAAGNVADGALSSNVSLFGAAVEGSEITDNTIEEVDLEATNAATDDFILSYDLATGGFTWVADNSGTDNQSLFETIDAPNGTDPVADNSTDTLSLADGSGITVTGNATTDTITIAATLGTDIVTGEIVDDTILEVDLDSTNAPTDDYVLTYDSGSGGFTWEPDATGGTVNSFETVDTPAGTDPVADSSTDTLTYSNGAGITITGNSTTDTVTIASTLGVDVDLTSEVTGTLPVGSGGTGQSTLTAGGVLFGNGASAITNSGVLANGQLLIGDGSGDPAVATLTQGTGVSIVNGAGSITIAATLGTSIQDAEVDDDLTISASGAVADGALSANVSLLGSAIEGSEITDNTIEEVDLEATNSATDNFILSYDLASGGFTWIPDDSGSDSQNLFETIDAANGTDPVADSATDTLTLADGSGITVTGNATTDTITIAATLGTDIVTGEIVDDTILEVDLDSTNAPTDDYVLTYDSGSGGFTWEPDATGGTINSFETQDAPAGTDPVADSTTDTLTWANGSGITITGNATTDTITVAATLGADIVTGEIVDSTILEVDLDSSNAPTDNYVLSYDSGGGGFTWIPDDTGSDSQNLFETIDAPNGTDPVADSSTDTLALADGSGITITGNATTDTVTIAATLGTDIVTGEIVDDTILEVDLDSTNAPTDDYVLTYDSGSGGFTWEPDATGGTVNSFETIDTPAGTDPVADSSTDTFTYSNGAGITITGNATTDTVTIASTLGVDVDLTSEVTGTLPVGSGGTGVTSITTGGVVFGNGTSAITNSGVLANGQLLIGDGSGNPSVATLTQGTGITITNGAGTISIAATLGTSIQDGEVDDDLTISSSGSVADGALSANVSLLGGSIEGSEITENTIEEVDLEATNSATDNYILSYDLATGGFTWIPDDSGTDTQNLFETIDAANGTDPVADSTTDTLTLADGSGITVTGNATTDTITIAATLGTDIVTGEIVDDTILEVDLDSTNAPTDNFVLTYDSGSGGFTWEPDATGGTINSFETQDTPNGTDPVADTTTDTLTWADGSGITITGNSTTDTITVAATLGTDIVTGEIVDDTLLEVDLDSTNGPTDNFVLSYDSGSGGFTWIPDDTGSDAQNLFETIDAPNGTDPVADSATDTLTYADGAGITITGNSTTDTITIASTLGVDVDLTSEVTGTLPVGNGGTGQTTLTAGGVLFGNGASAITNSGVLANGQLLIGDGSGNPTVATLTQGTGVSITNGAGTITIAATLGTSIQDGEVDDDLTISGSGSVADGALSANVSLLGSAIEGSEITDDTIEEVDLEITNAGTDNYILSYDLATGGFTWVPDDTGTDAQNLFETIDAPNGTDPVADSSTDTLALADGSGITVTGNATTDTITIAATLGTDIVTGEIVDDTILEVDLDSTNAPTDDYVLTYDSGSGGFTWEPDATGGTINSFETIDTPAGTDPVADSSTDTITYSNGAGITITGNATTDTVTIASTLGVDVDLTSEVTGTLPVGNGGTGATSLTAGGVLFGNGTSAITNSGVLANGELLIGDGSGDPTVTTLTDGTGVTITEGAGSITIAATLGTDIVTGEIVDDTILEADFDATNAPTDDYILSYDLATGGFTWVPDATGGTINSFETQDTPGGTDPVADSSTDTLTWANGSGITITGNATTDTITVAATLGTDIVTGEIVDDTLLEVDLDATNAPTDNYVLTYDSGSGGFTWEADGTGSPGNSFETIDAPGGTDPVADSSTDTLTFANGSGITVTGNSTTDTITIAATLGTDIVTGEIVDDTILEVDLDSTNAPTDNYVLTYDSGSGGFTWEQDATGSAGNAFETFDAPNGTDPVADSSTDTITYTDGSGITITGNATTDTITIAATLGANIEDAEVDDDITISSSGSVDSTALSDGGTISFDWVDAEVEDALTISAGGSVADGALSANVSLLGPSIAGSEIVDNTIEEVDLEVTNAGTDNYILSYDLASGGFTWVPDDTGSDSQNLFQTINASAGTDPVADSATDTLNVTGSSGVVVTGNSTTDTLTITATLGTNIEDGEVDNDLTISGSGSVADGALSANVSLLGSSIAGNEITDNTIEEVDLEVTNAATDNFVLTYDSASGGFTWVDGATLGSSQDLFETFDAPNGTDPVADSATDTITWADGSGIIITGNATTDTITVAATLGTDIVTGEIVDDTILEVDLDATNGPTDNYVLTYDSGSGGFTWEPDATGGTVNSFETQDTPAGTDPVADSTTDTLTWANGSGITISGNSTTDTITIAATLGTDIVTGEIVDDTLLEVDLDSTNAPTDNYVLSYDSGSGGFTWIQDDTGSDSQNLFETIDAPNGTDPIADSSTDTLTFTDGAGITITGAAASDSITIAATLGASISDGEVDNNITVDWAGLQNYPSACGVGTAVTALSDSPTCSAFNTDTSITLQDAYTEGNTITTTDVDNAINFVLADTTDDENLDIDIEADNSVLISRLNNSNTEAPAQLLLVENLDTNLSVANGISITDAGGGLADAIDVSDSDITNAINIGGNTILGTTGVIDFTNFDLAGDGQISINAQGAQAEFVFSGDNTVELFSEDSVVIRIDSDNDSVSTFNIQNSAGTLVSLTETGTFTVGNGSTSSSLVLSDGSSNNGTIRTAALGSDEIYNLPDSDGDDTFCLLDLANCAGTAQNLFETFDAPAGTDPIADSATDTFTFANGSGITITGNATTDTVTIAATLGTDIVTGEIVDDTLLEVDLDSTNAPTDNYVLSYDSGSGGFTWIPDDTGSDSQNLFQTINASSGTDPVADTATDTLNLTAGTGITVTGNSGSDTVTFAATLGTSIQDGEVDDDLTISGSGSVADGALSANVSLLGSSIAGNEITDNTIEEVDLEVTNAPTDNYVLTYDSATGGFTWVDDSSVGASYSAGDDLDLSGSTFDIEPTLNFVTTITRDSSALTLQTTTSGNIELITAGNIDANGENIIDVGDLRADVFEIQGDTNTYIDQTGGGDTLSFYAGGVEFIQLTESTSDTIDLLLDVNVTGSVVPSADSTYDLGSSSFAWQNIYADGSLILAGTNFSESDLDALDDGTITLGTETTGAYDTTDDSVVGNVDSAEITNDTIREVDLDVTNSPTDNYALTYDSGTGGYTWVDPSTFGGGAPTLQDVYDNDGDGGNSVITTTDADDNIEFNLHNSAGTDPSFIVNIQGGGNTFEIRDGGTAFATFSNNGEFLLYGDDADIFSVQDTGGTETFAVDNSLNAVGIGVAPVDRDRLQVSYQTASSTAGDQKAIDIDVDDIGAISSGTDTTYGIDINVARNGSATGGTIDTYGLNVYVSGDEGSATGGTSYGLFVDNNPLATNNYAAVFQGGTSVFNETGLAAADFRVEGDNDQELFFVDADAESVGIGTSTPGYEFHVTNTSGGTTVLAVDHGSNDDIRLDVSGLGGNIRFGSGLTSTTIDINHTGDLFFDFGAGDSENIVFRNAGGAIFNQQLNDSDFQVSGDTEANLLYVDAGNDRVGIGTSSPGQALTIGDGSTADQDLLLSKEATATSGNGQESNRLLLQASAWNGGPAVDRQFQLYTVGDDTNGDYSFIIADNSGNTMSRIYNFGDHVYNSDVIGDTVTHYYFENSPATLGVNSWGTDAAVKVTGRNGVSDAYIQFDTAGGDEWVLGLDDSDSQALVLSRASSLGTSNVLRIDQTSRNVSFNNSGADADFQVQGDTDADLLYVNAGSDQVGISEASPSHTLDVGGTLQVTGATDLDGHVDLGNGTGDNITLVGYVDSDILPDADDTYDLGSSTLRWQDLYLGPASLHIGTDGDEGVLSYNTTANSFEFDQQISPNANNTFDLGTNALAWNDIYADGNLVLNGTTFSESDLDALDNGTITLGSETSGTYDSTPDTIADDGTISDAEASNSLTINWTGLQNYPSACGAGLAATAVGDTLTCQAILSYSAGDDINISGTDIDIEPTLNFVQTITRASSDLTLQTTTSGDVVLNPADNIQIGAPLIPDTNNSYDLGSGSFAFNDIYADGNLVLNGTTFSESDLDALDNGTITLSTETTGDYVADVTGGTAITVTGSPGEGWTPTIAVTNDSIGDTQLAFNTGQHLTTTSAPTFATINTGQGANELYDMNQNVLTTSTVGFTEIRGGNGALNNPSFTFTSDGDLGLYRHTSNHLGITTGNALSGLFDANGLQVADGAAGTPSLSFHQDGNTGFYRYGADQVGLSLGGTKRFHFSYGGNGSRIYGNETNDYFEIDGTNEWHQFFINDTEILRLRALSPFFYTGLEVIRSGSSPLVVDRTTNDGPVITIQGQGTTEGSINVSGATVSYNGFTGSHLGYSTNEQFERGYLVRLTGENRNLNDVPASEIVYGITKTVTENDPRILGSFLSIVDESLPLTHHTNPYQVMSVGNGDVWVVDEGEDIDIGDYLISSSTVGHARKDPQTDPISNVFARAAENVDWDTVTTTINGKKRYKMSVTFEFFERDNLTGTLQADNLDIQQDASIVGDLDVGNNLNVTGVTTTDELSVTNLATIDKLDVVDLATINNLEVTGSTSVADIEVNGHIISAGSNPTITADLAVGNTPTVAVDGNDTAGTITFTAGSGSTDGDVLRIDFNDAYGKAPNVVLTAGNEDAADLNIFRKVDQDGFVLSTSTTLSDGVQYEFDYFVIE